MKNSSDSQQEKWIKELDYLLDDRRNHWDCNECEGGIIPSIVEDFISQTIQSARREAVEQVIESFKIKGTIQPKDNEKIDEQWARGHNYVVGEIELIKQQLRERFLTNPL